MNSARALAGTSDPDEEKFDSEGNLETRAIERLRQEGCDRFIRILLTCCVALLLRTLPVVAHTDVTGVWSLKITTADGNVVQTYFDLQRSGERVTGSVWHDYEERPIRTGIFRKGKFHFDYVLWPWWEGGKGIFDGKVEGDKLRLTVQLPFNLPGKGVAARTTREAATRPPSLPLPKLHDVPDNGLARTPPMGWNSWYKFTERIDDATVRAMADAMVASGMREAGYTYINIDDCWAGPRDAQGNITGNLKFPNMKGLVDYVHSKGLKIGIYSSPGPATAGSYTGSYGHEVQDAKTFAAWGFDYFKYDWTTADQFYRDSDMQAVYEKMGEALAASGRPIVYNLCQYGKAEVWKWGAKVGGNLWRTGDDIGDNWQSIVKNGFSQFDIASFARPGHWNDPDMLQVGLGGMTADEYSTQMSLWSLLAAPLIASNDLRSMSEETKSILMNTEVIAIDQDPEAKPVRKISEQGKLVVAARPLRNRAWAVGLFNRGDARTKMSVPWSDLGLHGNLRVRDLWAHKDLGKVADQFLAKVPAHGVVLITVKR
jgi:alpha-galactosidase